MFQVLVFRRQDQVRQRPEGETPVEATLLGDHVWTGGLLFQTVSGSILGPN